MSRGLRQPVRDNLEKCRLSAISAVEAYNRPGPRFRTAQYLILIVMAWTALFHAIFYNNGRRPWYRIKNVKAIRYQKIDGEPKHWDLSECLKQHFGGNSTPERRNLEFLIGLRNKIEHRHLPALDASLYGECQAALLNLEDILVANFGARYALQEQLAVSLQFSRIVPEQKKTANRALASSSSKSVIDYVEKFRGNLPSTVLSSVKYSFNVYLVPKVVNRESAADSAIEFVKVDEASPEELDRLSKLNVLIREKHIPISNLDLHKPSFVVAEVAERVSYRFNMNTHTDAWKHYEVRPEYGAAAPEKTKQEYCVYDSAHGDYLYTNAWIDRLSSDFDTSDKYLEITGRTAVPK